MSSVRHTYTNDCYIHLHLRKIKTAFSVRDINIRFSLSAELKQDPNKDQFKLKLERFLKRDQSFHERFIASCFCCFDVIVVGLVLF